MYPSLYCKGSKRAAQGPTMRGSWRPNRTEIFWPPLLWPSAVCLSCSPDAQPEAQRPTLLGDGFLYCILSASSLDLNSSGPQAPSAWCGFPYHTSSISVSSSNWNWNSLTSVLTELYNSSTSTQSPTRSLESNVGSSSIGSNCHAVQRSLSSDASWEFFYLVPFHLPISAHAISSHNCQCVTSFRCIPLEWHFWPGQRPKYNTRITQKYCICTQACFRIKLQGIELMVRIIQTPSDYSLFRLMAHFLCPRHFKN